MLLLSIFFLCSDDYLIKIVKPREATSKHEVKLDGDAQHGGLMLNWRIMVVKGIVRGRGDIGTIEAPTLLLGLQRSL
jgi:hypothetical protein